ncbi:hypothetical protein EV644_12974 [Kribbella orskensis]|uniref:Uncharacterized protein n=1 Tax=Kribbella orskensis TaxID=2512216 RepID=A0ABY2B8Z4_9ACTN|nr:hypothetical protein EV642_13174 [Kribbella sp. VKM Ac-2500]TCO11705.1 hypothetical protein EV644_12974 [Kribbella orskensis]
MLLLLADFLAEGLYRGRQGHEDPVDSEPIEEAGGNEVVAEVCLTLARARTIPRPTSSSRNASSASTAVMSISTFASVFSGSQRTSSGELSIAAIARRRKSSAFAKNSGESYR